MTQLTCLHIALPKVLIGYALHQFEPDMEHYFKRKSVVDLAPPTLETDKNDQAPSTLKKSRVVVDFKNLPAYPRLRSPISSYHLMDRDEIRECICKRALVSLMTINSLIHSFDSRRGGLMLLGLRIMKVGWSTT